MTTLQKNDICDIVENLYRKKIMDCRCIYNTKWLVDRYINQFKSRKVAKDYSQIPIQNFNKIVIPVVH
jgi:hypothetical protein